MEYAKVSIPRPVFERATTVAEEHGFRSASEAITAWARERMDALQSQRPVV